MERFIALVGSLVFALVLLLGCTVPVDVDPDDLSFSAELVGSQESVPDFAVTGGAGSIHFQGAMGTPVPCYDIDGRLRTDRRTVVPEVTAAPRDEICVQVVATFAYEATVIDLPPGTYPVEIVHVWEGRHEAVFEGEAEVD